jgi:GRAS domain family
MLNKQFYIRNKKSIMSTSTTLPPVFGKLYQLVSVAEHESFEQVTDELHQFYRHCTDGMEEDSSKFLSALLLNTYMANKGGGLSHENLYLRNYEVSQIQLFDILISRLPYVKYSQAIVNRKIAEMLEGFQEATLLDIGIGLGTQVRNILSQCRELKGLKKLVVVGIEPGAEALATAKQSILAMQAEMPFTIEFKGYHGFAENMDLTTLDYGTPNLIVNASLALHHIQTNEKRTQVLEQIKLLNPAGLFLIEPNVNHFEPSFLKRFCNCFNHFYALFKTIDGLDIHPNEKSALKLFFGREMEDIIGKPEVERFEKHEPAASWINRLKLLDYEMKSDLLKLPVSLEAGVQIAHHTEGFIGFTFEKETVLSIIYAA